VPRGHEQCALVTRGSIATVRDRPAAPGTLAVMLTRGRLVGVVHLLPLPGSPRWAGDMNAVVRRAVKDAAAYEKGGAGALIVENYGDAPFLKADLFPETVAALARCAAAVRDAVDLPLGVNALRNDARAALGVAVACGASFIRVNVHAGTMATDQGLVEGDAAGTLRARAGLGAAETVSVLADVHVKHARPLVDEDPGRAAADLVERAGADGLVVSGPATGEATDPADLEAVRRAAPDALLLAGSGATKRNAARLLELADGLIVGTSLKRGGRTAGPVDVTRVRAFVKSMG